MPRDRGMHGTVRYAALALAVAACGGPVTGPRPVAARLATPATTLNQLQAISAVTNTPLFESFTVLAPRFTPASATGSVALALALDFAARYSRWRRGEPRTAHHRVPTPYPVLRHAGLTPSPPRPPLGLPPCPPLPHLRPPPSPPLPHLAPPP